MEDVLVSDDFWSGWRLVENEVGRVYVSDEAGGKGEGRYAVREGFRASVAVVAP